MMKMDVHTHILPGIDDGARNWDECLDMISKSAECGVEKIIATPHYLPWKAGATPEDIRQLCAEAEEKIKRKLGISMDIYPGHEIYYSLEVIQNLKEGKVLTLAGSRYVLVEFDPGTAYHVICRAVKDFKDAGYIPIIAHVERYVCLQVSGKLEELKDMGALFQMNIGALQGSIFDAVSRRSKKYLSNEMIDFLASDMHDATRRTPFTKEKLLWVQKKLEPAYQRKLLWGNADKIVAEIKA